MTTYGAVLVGRNDNYGEHQAERAAYSINFMVSQLDQVIFVDWATEDGKVTLVEEIGDWIIKSPKFSYIKVTKEQADEWNNYDPEAQAVCEVMARNIGLRRLNTDFLISTNPDVIPPYRHHLEDKFTSKTSFATISRRNISLFDIQPLGSPKEIEQVMSKLETMTGRYGQQPYVEVCKGDKFSLVSCPGDFQIAHRDVWYTIRGFEESLNGRGFADSNVQRKAHVYGYQIYATWDVPVWHIGHVGGGGGIGKVNDMQKAIFMESTENPDTWGHSDVDLEVRSI